ncbi:hypothetical protein IV102_09835 [bacterium]|nr:hypothetical protein [bacterium]
MTQQKLLNLWQRAFTQIALYAAVDAQRVFELAETMDPMLEFLDDPDADQRIADLLDSYCRRYPDGSAYLKDALRQ